MKEFKGTKGKWYADIHPTGYCTVLSELNDGGTIAEVGDGTYWGNGSETVKANTHLIAAAPEMLKVLVGMTLSMKANPDYLFGRSQEFIDYVESAEKVINKALGL